MRKLLIITCAIILVSCSNKYKSIQNTDEDYNILPIPTKTIPNKGRFLVDNKTVIVGNESLGKEGRYLAEMLSLATGNHINYLIDADMPKQNNIVLKLDTNIENEEGYTLSVNYNQIIITGKNSKGVFYGIQSLRQLMPPSIEAKDGSVTDLTIPDVFIEDAPQYSYRGMHLDVGRHFFPVSFIKEYIDLIAMHKMNTFHWHLTEDQGWRIEIKKYPKLTEVGAYRNGTIVGHYPGTSNDDIRYGGFYTQEQIKDVVTYALSRHVTIIPEIELPGHSAAAIAAYPFLSCFPEEPSKIRNNMISIEGKELQEHGTPKIVQETWGVMDDVFCAGKESTFSFLEDVLDEILPLFPSKYIHIGGDECPKGNWKRCPNCIARMKVLHLKDEHELQSYFIQRIEKFVNSKGKNIIGWDEILEGGLAPNATVMSWRGTDGGIEAAKQRHNVVMTPGEYCYFDHYQSKNKEEPLAIGGFLPVETVYSYDPTPNELTKDEKKYILGAQGNVWTEYMKTTDYVEYMVLPRMTALSEVVWSSNENKDWNDFKKRLASFRKRYDALGLNYAKHVFNRELH